MYVCYLFETDSSGNKKSGSTRVKLPVVPRLGDYVNLSVVQGEGILTLAGIVKSVDMYCSIDEGDSESYQDGIPEAKQLIWYITIEQKESAVN